MDDNQVNIIVKKVNTIIKTLEIKKTEVEYREELARALKEGITPKIKALKVTIKKEEDTLEVKN
jgi:hypothetical protein